MRPGGSVNIVQLISGLLFLFTGIAIYWLIRGHALPYLPEALVVHGLFSYHITQLTHQLPTFTHLIAFTLFTAAMLGGGRRSAALVCLFWLFIEITFEVAQHPNLSSLLVPSVPHWFDNIWLLDRTRDYLLSGTFDPLDIVAAVVAAPLGYLMINITEAPRVLYKSNSSQIIAIKMNRSPS